MRTIKMLAVGLLLSLWGVVAHAGTHHYYYTDPQGTVLAKADASGHIIATYDYAPYGSQALGSPTNGPGYTGHVNDADTGLVYMQARYYDPVVGRFLSADPVGPSPGSLFHFNRYDYASNNPIVNMDPDGRDDNCMGNMQCEGGGVHYDGGGGSESGSSQETQPPSPAPASAPPSSSVASIGAATAALPKAAEGLPGASILLLRASPWLMAAAISGDTAHKSDDVYVYVTYTRVQPSTGLVYSGRTSGWINLRQS